ncbi:anthrone oxygenase family protein [Marinilactibacillus sp. XAAS-LB27]|uniref:anthrone oxygenase family protein n=1 Tax=Marinilactibacillus sp. XAAS-LB27 TaxID=3114538 RepID=UPI002E191EB7|nr:anthrone oxygenase family protein [Marinilactibacillus sp. XAAS-LB27]
MDDLVNSLLFFSLIGSGLVAGMFFAFSNFIMKAFSKVSHSNGMTAMQEINKTVLNPWFFLFFLGTALSSVVLMILYFFTSLVTVWGLIGATCYFFGCFMVTGIRNVPLNNELAKVNTEDKESKVWRHFLKTWTTWNHVRTLASLVAMILFLINLLSSTN